MVDSNIVSLHDVTDFVYCNITLITKIKYKNMQYNVVFCLWFVIYLSVTYDEYTVWIGPLNNFCFRECVSQWICSLAILMPILLFYHFWGLLKWLLWVADYHFVAQTVCPGGISLIWWWWKSPPMPLITLLNSSFQQHSAFCWYTGMDIKCLHTLGLNILE